MKRLFLFILLVNAINANGQGFSGVQGFLPDIVVHQTYYSGGKASIGKMVFDGANNKYILGWFDGIMDFDPGPNIHSDTSVGTGNLFIIKEDASGNFVWVKQFDGLPSPYGRLNATEIDLDGSGNIYIAGTIQDSFDLDPGPGVYHFPTDRSGVAFILKLDALGNFVWAKSHEVDSIPGWSNIIGMKVIGDAIYSAISFYGTVDLDPGPGIFNVSSNLGGGTNMALIKMDTAGNFIWGKVIGGGKGINNLNSFAIDNAANLYITGGFQDTVDFDPGPGVYTLTATPWAPGIPFGYNTDIFIAKYDAAGNLTWAHSIGGEYNDEGKCIAVDRFGNVIVSGFYKSYGNKVDFDPGPGVYNLKYYPSDFTLKLRNNGDFAWARNAGSSNIATDDTGNVYIGLKKFDTSGNSLWTGKWKGEAPKVGWLGLDKYDTIYVSGVFSGFNTDFDPGKGEVFLPGFRYATSSGFILKLDQYIQPDFSLGMNGTNLPTDLSVYPNPSSGIITFSSPLAIERIKLTDIAGRMVLFNEPNQTKTLIDLGNQAKGVYFYEVDCGSGKQRGKLVIY